MKLFFESIIIFFGTLIAAALVALGEPGATDLAIVKAVVGHPPQTLETRDAQVRHTWSMRAVAPIPH